MNLKKLKTDKRKILFTFHQRFKFYQSMVTNTNALFGKDFHANRYKFHMWQEKGLFYAKLVKKSTKKLQKYSGKLRYCQNAYEQNT